MIVVIFIYMGYFICLIFLDCFSYVILTILYIYFCITVIIIMGNVGITVSVKVSIIYIYISMEYYVKYDKLQ